MQSDDRVIFMSRHYYIHRMTMTMASTKTNSILFLRDSTMRKRVKYSTPLTSKSLRQSMASRCAQNKQFPNSMSDKYHHRRALPKSWFIIASSQGTPRFLLYKRRVITQREPGNGFLPGAKACSVQFIA